jgi:hypothetical protein
VAASRTQVKVEGYREFIRATKRAEKESRTEVQDALKEAGEVVREPWRGRLERFGSRTATGLKTRLRAGEVAVEQTRRKVTGLRPDFGFRQQLIGDEVAEEREGEIQRELERAVDRIADHFER